MRSGPEGAYIVWILISTVGLLQALASYYGWLGLSFFRANTRVGYLFAAIVIPVAYVWFFSLADRNVPGLEGWQLFSRFGVGAAGGLAVVLALSSLLNRGMQPDSEQQYRNRAHPGVDALQSDTYIHLVMDSLHAASLLRQPEEEHQDE
jgi:hypothetical protein